MITEKTMQGIRVTDYIGSRRVSMHYIGYTETQAKKKFKAHLKTLKP